ncbi:hypothetical protein TNCV_2723371 [Trichonephila clavipes]|nr:hypothetical protein TNCV_2723371 [Trichonephila clavipes]
MPSHTLRKINYGRNGVYMGKRRHVRVKTGGERMETFEKYAKVRGLKNRRKTELFRSNVYIKITTEKHESKRAFCNGIINLRKPVARVKRKAAVGQASRKKLPVINRLNINVALFSYTRAFGDGPHNFEPWSSDVDDT